MPRPRLRSQSSERPAHSLPGSPPLDGDHRAPASGRERYTRRRRGADAVASAARPGRRATPTRRRTITPCRAASNEAGPAPTAPVAAWSSSRRQSHAPPRVWGTTPSPDPTIPRPRSTSAPSAKPGHLLPGSPPLDGDHRAPRAVENDTLAATGALTLLHRRSVPGDARRRHAAGRSPHAERRPKRLIQTNPTGRRPVLKPPLVARAAARLGRDTVAQSVARTDDAEASVDIDTECKTGALSSGFAAT